MTEKQKVQADLWNTKKLSERKFWFLKDVSAEELPDIDLFSPDIALDGIERGEQVRINLGELYSCILSET